MPDEELEFGPDLVMHHRGRPFTGIAFGIMDDGTRSELSYVSGLQHGPARDWDASGRLRAEETWDSNARHGPSRIYDESGAVISERWFVHDKLVSGPAPEA